MRRRCRECRGRQTTDFAGADLGHGVALHACANSGSAMRFKPTAGGGPSSAPWDQAAIAALDLAGLFEPTRQRVDLARAHLHQRRGVAGGEPRVGFDEREQLLAALAAGRAPLSGPRRRAATSATSGRGTVLALLLALERLERRERSSESLSLFEERGDLRESRPDLIAGAGKQIIGHGRGGRSGVG